MAQTRTVVIGIGVHIGHTIEVFRNGLRERRALADEGVVVDNVHDYGDTAVMQRLNQHLEFLDTGVTVIGIGRIGTLGNVIVLGIVTPVAVNARVGLVDGSKVLDRHQLYTVDVVLYEIVYAGSDLALAVDGGVALGEREVLTAVRFTYAGGNVDREITNMDLPNNSLTGVVKQNVVVLIPACGIGRIQIADHGTVAVRADSLRIGVNSLVDSAVAINEIGVIGVFQIAGFCQRPDPGRAVIGHRIGAEYGSARLSVGTGGKHLNHNRGRFGSPYLKGSSARRIGNAKSALVRSLLRIALQVTLVCSAGAGEVSLSGRSRYGEHRQHHDDSQSHGDKPTNFHVILSFRINTYYGTAYYSN